MREIEGDLRVQTADYQTVELCYSLSAFRGASDTQGSDWKGRFEERGLRFEEDLERNKKFPHEM